jgi:hypothetical protein
LIEDGGQWQRHEDYRTVDGVDYRIHRYRPRIEGLFARIERWTHLGTGEIHWRSITRDNITTLYGKSNNSRIFDPEHPTRIFSWLICESYDDKGNVIAYGYQAEDDRNVDQGQANERNRLRTANRYLNVSSTATARRIATPLPGKPPTRPSFLRGTGCSRWSLTMANTTRTTRSQTMRGNGSAATIPFPLIEPDLRSAPIVYANAC